LLDYAGIEVIFENGLLRTFANSTDVWQLLLKVSEWIPIFQSRKKNDYHSCSYVNDMALRERVFSPCWN